MFVCLMMFIYTFVIYVCMLNDVYLHIFLYIELFSFGMDDNRRRAMYDGFNSVTLGHSKEWVRVAKQFVDLADLVW